jgi:hypothetical protein
MESSSSSLFGALRWGFIGGLVLEVKVASGSGKEEGKGETGF